jgi:hypothetical protein
MSNDPVITPGGGPTTPAAGTVTPPTISQGAADDFAFPRDVKVGRNIIGEAVTMVIKPNADGVNCICFQAVDGTVILSINTQNDRVGFFTATPQAHAFVKSVDLEGDLFLGNILSMGGYSGVCAIDIVNPYVGVGFPTMTQVQRRAISTTARRAGNTVVCTDTDGGDGPGMYYDDGAAWQKITATPAVS